MNSGKCGNRIIQNNQQYELFVWCSLNFLSSGCRKKLSSLCVGQSQTKRCLEQKVKLTYPEPICLLPWNSS